MKSVDRVYVGAWPERGPDDCHHVCVGGIRCQQSILRVTAKSRRHGAKHERSGMVPSPLDEHPDQNGSALRIREMLFYSIRRSITKPCFSFASSPGWHLDIHVASLAGRIVRIGEHELPGCEKNFFAHGPGYTSSSREGFHGNDSCVLYPCICVGLDSFCHAVNKMHDEVAET